MNSKVATVMPEMGLDDEPISPVRRDDTVTNKNPNTAMSSAPSRFMCSFGASVITVSRTKMPMPTNLGGRSRSVRRVLAEASPRPAARASFKPSRKPAQMVGMERTRLTRPPAVTAPAPMYST